MFNFAHVSKPIKIATWSAFANIREAKLPPASYETIYRNKMQLTERRVTQEFSGVVGTSIRYVKTLR